MAYPPDYHRLYNFNNDAARGLDSPGPARVDAELNLIHESITDMRRVVVGITTADGKIRPTQPINAAVVVLRDPEETVVAGAPQTVFPFAVAIDSTTTALVVYVDGVRLDSTEVVGFDNAEVTLTNAVAVGSTVVIEFYDNEGGILTQLADDTVGTEGADLVGYGDEFGQGLLLPIPGAPNTVKAGLDLAFNNIRELGDELLPATQFLHADGSVPFAADQDADGFTLTGIRVAAANGEPVEYSQLVDLDAAFNASLNLYLLLDGTAPMIGDLDMGLQQVVNMADGVDATDGATVGQIAGLLPLSGGTMTGDIDMDGNTIEGLPEPTLDDEAATKGYVDTAGVALQAEIDLLEASIDTTDNGIFDHFIGGPRFVETEGATSRVTITSPSTTDAWGVCKIAFAYAFGNPNDIGSIATRQINWTAFTWSLEARVRCVNWTDSDGRACVGVVNPNAESDGVPRGVYFYARSDQNSGNWQVAWRQGAVTTVFNTSSPATNWLDLKVEYTAAGEHEFYINDVLVYTITAVDSATIVGTLSDPTTAFSVGVTGGVDGSIASGQGIEIDWMRFREEV